MTPTRISYDGKSCFSLEGGESRKKLFSNQRQVGRGSGGVVYLSQDSQDRPVILKVLQGNKLIMNAQGLRSGTVQHFSDGDSDGIVWFRALDGALMATRLSGGNRHRQMTLSDCVDTFGLHCLDVPCCRIPTNYERFLKQREIKLREAQHQFKFTNNKNVVKIYGVLEDLNFNLNEAVIILCLEFCRGGDLINHLESYAHLTYSPGLDVEDLRAIAQQLVQVLSALHDDGIVHLDLKLDNIMCDTFASQPVVVKFLPNRDTWLLGTRNISKTKPGLQWVLCRCMGSRCYFVHVAVWQSSL
jgi:serine/threonine protein kinase